jgi:hypothetical protein
LKKIILFFIVLSIGFFSQKATAQTDSCRIKISVLTCASGDEAYANFGHTAIRIIDSINHTDLVYNYGTFDFDDPDFLMKFIRGRLDYFLSVDRFENFIVEYQYEKRSIYEQELRLNCEQKQAIISALQNNLMGKNRYYKYEFLFDNCTTRIRDLIFNNVTTAHIPHPIVPDKTTYRNLLHSYLNKDGKPWTKLGIDILLGSIVDKQPDVQQSMFLPDYLMKGLNSSQLKDTTALVLKESLLLNETSTATDANNNIPFIVSILLAAIVIIFSFLKTKWASITIKIFDTVFLFVTGVLGLLLLSLWLGSDHTEMQNNYNIFWTLPTNIFGVFIIWMKRKIFKKYFILTTVLTGLLLIAWFIIPQQLNIAIFPVAIMALIRYIRLAKK